MQSIISANVKSKTEAEAEKDAMIPYYSASKALPALGIQPQKVYPYITFTGPIAGNSLTWKLPPGAGFLYDCSLGFSCTSAALIPADINNHVGQRFIRQLDWMSNGQPVLTQTGAAIRALAKTVSADEQAFINRYSLPLVVGTEELAEVGATAFITYTPLIASWLTSVEKDLLLNVIGDLQLRITFETQAITGFSVAISLASSNGAILYCNTYMPKLSVYQQQLINDWSKTLVMECFNTYTETVPMSTVTTVSNYTITCPFLVFRTHVFVENIIAPAKTFPVHTISLNVGGVPLFDNFPRSRTLTLKSKSMLGSAGIDNNGASPAVPSLVYDNKDHLIIDWGVHSTRDRNVGTAFMQELRGMVLSITCETVAVAQNANMYLVHEYWQDVAFQPGASGAGRLEVYQNA